MLELNGRVLSRAFYPLSCPFYELRQKTDVDFLHVHGRRRQAGLKETTL